MSVDQKACCFEIYQYLALMYSFTLIQTFIIKVTIHTGMSTDCLLSLD